MAQSRAVMTWQAVCEATQGHSLCSPSSLAASARHQETLRCRLVETITTHIEFYGVILQLSVFSH